MTTAKPMQVSTRSWRFLVDSMLGLSIGAEGLWWRLLTIAAEVGVPLRVNDADGKVTGTSAATVSNSMPRMIALAFDPRTVPLMAELQRHRLVFADLANDSTVVSIPTATAVAIPSLGVHCLDAPSQPASDDDPDEP